MTSPQPRRQYVGSQFFYRRPYPEASGVSMACCIGGCCTTFICSSIRGQQPKDSEKKPLSWCQRLLHARTHTPIHHSLWKFANQTSSFFAVIWVHFPLSKTHNNGCKRVGFHLPGNRSDKCRTAIEHLQLNYQCSVSSKSKIHNL